MGAHAGWIFPAPSALTPPQSENPPPPIFYILLGSRRYLYLFKSMLYQQKLMINLFDLFGGVQTPLRVNFMPLEAGWLFN